MNQRRILLADDHPGVVRALTALLRPTFDVVGTVGDGFALLDAATVLAPDVILADISMPRLDGLAALTRLKQANPQIPIVFMSMYHDAVLEKLVLQAGAAGFVAKDSAATDLIPALNAALDGRVFISPST